MELKEKSITIVLTEDMLGTVPKDKETYKTYIEAKKPKEVSEEETETVENLEIKGWTGFHIDDTGLFVYNYFMKGFFKHAGNVMKEILGIKAFRSKLDDFFFIYPRRIYLQNGDGTVIK
ncbi:MAG TPA: hypothetical protein ENH82_03640, partial [bacterium]|nr:hypothetical protein [bacterium]